MAGLSIFGKHNNNKKKWYIKERINYTKPTKRLTWEFIRSERIPRMSKLRSEGEILADGRGEKLAVDLRAHRDHKGAYQGGIRGLQYSHGYSVHYVMQFVQIGWGGEGEVSEGGEEGTRMRNRVITANHRFWGPI